MRRLILAIVLLLPFPLFSQHIPQRLRESGFNEYVLIHYYDDTAYEYYTFEDFSTDDPNDTITFVVREGKVLDYYKEK